jgi:hypothetical protein
MSDWIVAVLGVEPDSDVTEVTVQGYLLLLSETRRATLEGPEN